MAAPYPPGAPPGWPPPMGWSPSGVHIGNTKPADLAALSNFWTAALVAIVGSILGVAVPLTLSYGGYIRLGLPAAGSPFMFASNALYTVLGIALVGFALTIVSFWLYRGGFVHLRGVDPKFASSPTWPLLLIVGLVLVALALVYFVVAIVQIIACAGTSPTIPLSCVSLGALLGALALVGIGAIVGLIGFIGTLVAIWRLGDRYENSLFKIGAVLLIFPYLNVVGEILILVAASNARTQVQQRPEYPMAPSMPSPFPPRPPG